MYHILFIGYHTVYYWYIVPLILILILQETYFKLYFNFWKPVSITSWPYTLWQFPTVWDAFCMGNWKQCVTTHGITISPPSPTTGLGCAFKIQSINMDKCTTHRLYSHMTPQTYISFIIKSRFIYNMCTTRSIFLTIFWMNSDESPHLKCWIGISS